MLVFATERKKQCGKSKKYKYGFMLINITKYRIDTDTTHV